MEVLIIALVPLGVSFAIYRAGRNAGLAAGRKEELERQNGRGQHAEHDRR